MSATEVAAAAPSEPATAEPEKPAEAPEAAAPAAAAANVEGAAAEPAAEPAAEQAAEPAAGDDAAAKAEAPAAAGEGDAPAPAGDGEAAAAHGETDAAPEEPKKEVKADKAEELSLDEPAEKPKKGKKGKKGKKTAAAAPAADGDGDDADADAKGADAAADADGDAAAAKGKAEKSKKPKKSKKAEKPVQKPAPPKKPVIVIPKTKAQLAREASIAEREKREAAARLARELELLALEEEEGEEEVEEEQVRQRKKYHRREQKEAKRSIINVPQAAEKHGRKKHVHHGLDEDGEEESSSDWMDDDMLYDMLSYEDEDEGAHGKVKLTEKQLKHIYRAIKATASSVEEAESSSESSDVPDYVYQYSIEDLPDFFEILGGVPDIEDISMTTTESEQKDQLGEEEQIDVDSPEYKQKMALQAYMREMHRTGSDESLQRRDLGEHDSEGGMEEYSFEDSSIEPESDGSTMPYDPELDHLPQYSEDLPFLAATAAANEQDVLQELLVMEVEKPVVVVEVDHEELERLEQQRILHELTHEFLRALITKTLEFCEAEAETTRILKKLDKRYMMDELMTKLESLTEDTAQLKWLSRRATEFYRRKKAYRYITEDAIDVLERNKERFNEELKKLDLSLARLMKTVHIRNETLTKLREETDQAQEAYQASAAELDRLVRRALYRDNYPRLNEVVDQVLAKMFQLHKDVGEMRLSVIEKQHTIGYYIKKFAEINDLGNDLHMADFEYLQTEVQALSKKVEERNTELNKCHIRFNDDLHITAHIKEKQERIALTICELENQLANLIMEKLALRERVHDDTRLRKVTRMNIRKASLAGGLLYRTNLMLDYDETLDKADALRENIEQLKLQIVDYETKIAYLEHNIEMGYAP